MATSNNKADQKLHADIRKQAVSFERQAVDADRAGHPEMAKELRRRGALRNEDAVRLERQIRDEQAKPAAPSKAMTQKRQSAVEAYRKAFDRAPPKSLSIKGMTDAVAKGRVVAGRQAARREQVAGIFGSEVSQGRADAAGRYARAKFDAKVNPNVDAVRNLDAKAMGAKRKQPATLPPKPPALPSAQNMAMRSEIGLRTNAAIDAKGPSRLHPSAESWKWQAPTASPAQTASPKWNSGQVLSQVKPAATPVATPNNPVDPAARAATWSRVNTGLAVAGTGITVANAFNRARAEGKSAGDAAIDAAKAGAIPAAIAAANPISRGAGHVASGAFEVSKAMMSGTGFMDIAFLNMAFAKGAVISGAVGVAAKGVEIGAKIAGKVAAPAVAAYGAYQGAKEDVLNPGRGAARGAIRTLDPTGIFMAKGLGERAFDAAFGSAAPAGQATPAPKRLSDAQAKSFNAANASFGKSSGQSSRETEAKPKERAGQFVDVTNAHGTTFQRRNPKYGEWADG